VLEKTGWRITGSGGAAEVLGFKKTTPQSRMKKLGIKRPIPDTDIKAICRYIGKNPISSYLPYTQSPREKAINQNNLPHQTTTSQAMARISQSSMHPETPFPLREVSST